MVESLLAVEPIKRQFSHMKPISMIFQCQTNLRFIYGGMRHLVQHSRQLPKELLRQSRGCGVGWDSWWGYEMCRLDVAMLSPEKMLPFLNVWQEKGWGEEGFTHFVWHIMALKFWIRCSWWQLLNHGSVRFTSLRPKTHFQEASGEASAAQTKRWPGLWWDQRERLVSAFLTEDYIVKKYRTVSVHVFRTSQRCVYSSFPCKIRVSFLVKMSIIWLNNGFHREVRVGGNHPSLTTHSQSWGLRSLGWISLVWSIGAIKNKAFQNCPPKKRWILNKKIQIVPNQLSNFFETNGEKTQRCHVLIFEATNSWHRCFCEAHLREVECWYGFFEVLQYDSDILIWILH